MPLEEREDSSKRKEGMLKSYKSDLIASNKIKAETRVLLVEEDVMKRRKEKNSFPERLHSQVSKKNEKL